MGACLSNLLKVDEDLEERFTLTKKLGEGVEGQVWEAELLDRPGEVVAIKLVPRGDENGQGAEKLRSEIQLQARLSHVNIVELVKVVLTRRHLGIVMTAEQGGDLGAYCAAYRLDETQARYFFRQIVGAVRYCHAHRVAHRDLKLANFLLDGGAPPRIKLTDFGCAKQWKRAPSRKASSKGGNKDSSGKGSSGGGSKASKTALQRFRTYAGTPAYMAPQVLESAFYPTSTYCAPAADVWAVGILLTHIFFGDHTPFWLTPNALRGEAQTMQARVRDMKHTKWYETDSVLAEAAPTLSPELRDLLDKIFVADEAERITLDEIAEHPWYVAPLPDKLQAALDAMEEEQALRDGTARAAISADAGRHELASDTAGGSRGGGGSGGGGFATIDAVIDLAMSRGKMPNANQRVFELDMAHMGHDDAHSSVATGSPAGALSPDASAHYGGASSGGAVEAAATALGGGGSGQAVSLYEARGSSAGGGVAPMMPPSVYDRSSHGGGRSSHGGRSGHGGGGGTSSHGGGGSVSAHGGGIRRTLTLRKSESGVMLASYETVSGGGGAGGGAAGGGSVRGGSAGGSVRAGSAGGSVRGGGLGLGRGGSGALPSK